MVAPPKQNAPPHRPPRLSSLRARLITSHAAVILLALLIVLLVSAVWLRRDERRAQIDDLTNLAAPLLVETRVVTANRFSGRARPVREEVVAELFATQAADMDLRILVIDATGLVLIDTATDANLTFQFLAPYFTLTSRLIHAANDRDAVVTRVESPPNRATGNPFAGQIVLFAASGQPPGISSSPNVLVLVAAPRQQGVVARFIPPLLLALACALVVAFIAGYLLSRRLAAPVARLTQAADAMTSGILDQRVPAEGPDEIGRLVASFNAMSSRVAAVDRAQRDLLTNVSHELRTPITNVQGYTQALRDGLLRTPAEIDSALITIGSEADRMGHLIRQLLDLARLESGQTRLSLQLIPVRPIFESTQTRFAAQATEKQTAIHIDAPATLTLLADADRLAQILDNLVANSLRHTPPGGEIVLTALTRRTATGHPTVATLTVRDTGSGIPPDHLPSIFDRFTRGPDDPTGFGLGLAIAKNLTSLHNGTITVQSTLGTGTTFTLELPLAPQSQAAFPPSSTSRP